MHEFTIINQFQPCFPPSGCLSFPANQEHSAPTVTDQGSVFRSGSSRTELSLLTGEKVVIAFYLNALCVYIINYQG